MGHTTTAGKEKQVKSKSKQVAGQQKLKDHDYIETSPDTNTKTVKVYSASKKQRQITKSECELKTCIDRQKGNKLTLHVFMLRLNCFT